MELARSPTPGLSATQHVKQETPCRSGVFCVGDCPRFSRAALARTRIKRGGQLAFEGWREVGLFDDHESVTTSARVN